MNAEPLLVEIAAAFKKVKLEAVMIGNAAAALHGAPVTTLDIDFMFRDTELNRRKIRQFAELMRMSVNQPALPTSEFFRLLDKERGFQIDMLPEVIGVRSFAGLRSRAVTVYFGGNPLLIADLADIIKSKEAAGRPKDLAVLQDLKDTLHEASRQTQGQGGRHRRCDGEDAS